MKTRACANHCLRIAFATAVLLVHACAASAATIVWTNTSGGNWSTAVNWSPNQVPVPGDLVLVTNAGNYSVQMNSSAFIGSLVVGSGSAGGTQDLIVGGSMTVATSVSVLARGHLNITSGGFEATNGCVVFGAMSIGGANIIGRFGIEPGGTLLLTNAGTHVLSSVTLTNRGTVSWSAGVIYGYGGSIIHNAGLWRSEGSLALIPQTGANRFINTGTLQLASGVMDLVWEFHTTGTMDASSGQLNVSTWGGNNVLHGTVNWSGTLNSPLVIASNATLNWTSGSINSALTVESGALLSISNSSSFSFQGAGLTNRGTVEWRNGTLYGYGVTVHNEGLWRVAVDLGMITQTGTNRFLNLGTIQKTEGPNTAEIQWAFTSTGVVDVQSGFLDIGDFAGSNVLRGTHIGRATVSGSVAVSPTASATWTGGSINGSVSIQSGAALNWRGQSIFGVLLVEPGGLLNISNSSSFSCHGASMTNRGTTVWSGGAIYGYDSSVVANEGLWQIEGSQTLSQQTGTNRFINSGALLKTGGSGDADLNWAFTTTGSFDVQPGSLRIDQWLGDSTVRGALRWSGTLNAGSAVTIASNAVLTWLNGSINDASLTVAPGGLLHLTNASSYSFHAARLTNSGAVRWSSGTIYGYDGSVIHNAGLWEALSSDTISSQTGTNYFLNDGTIRNMSPTVSSIQWAFTTRGVMDVPTGSLALDNWTGSNVLAGTLRWSSGNLRGTVNAVSNAILNWSGGEISGALTISPGGAFSISNNGSFTLSGARITNFGSATWSGGTLYGYDNAIVHNGGFWDIKGNPTFSTQSGTNFFFNAGILRRLAGSGGPAFLDCSFTTVGTMDAPGTLIVGRFVGGSTLSGVLNWAGGTLEGTLDVLPGSSLRWNGGNIDGGALTVRPGGFLNVSNGSSISIQGGTVTNQGTMTWSSGVIYGYSSSNVRNEGFWEITGDVALSAQSGSNAFVNTGTFLKSGGNSATPLGWHLRNSGTIDVRRGTLSTAAAFIQDAGMTRLAGGNLSLTEPLQLLGGALTGTNVISGSVTNSAVISPGASAGVLTVNGNYVQTSSGRLDIELGGTNAGTGYDRLVINGSATLGGTLSITLMDPFEPALSNSFRVLTFNSFSGDFAGVHGLAVNTNIALQASLLATALDLVAVSNTNGTVNPPLIVSHPYSQTIINGQEASFTATVTGTRPLYYQWQFNEANLAGANALTLVIAHAQTNQSGDYRLVVTNMGGAATSSVAILDVRPVADLVVTEVSHPTNAIAGQPVTIAWRTLNQGSQSALAPWTESIALSTNSSGIPQVQVATYTANTSLVSGASSVRTQSVILPGGLDGDYYVVITADTGNYVVEELNESNNTLVSAGTMRVRSPDLSPILVSAPAAAQFGQSITVSWVTTNGGSAPANNWVDRIYLSDDANVISGELLDSTPRTNSVANGASTTNSAVIFLPLRANSVAGMKYILVQVDAADAVMETNEANNVRSAAMALTLPPLSDLAVENVSGPANAIPGQTVALSWITTNHGSISATSAWTETILLATNSVGAGATELVTLLFSNSLSGYSALTRTQQIVIPLDSPLGSVWFAVKADSRNDVFEAEEGNNIGIATNATVIPAVLTLHVPAAELREGDTLLATVTRNGSRVAPLTVSITNSDATELIAPASVIIPSGQASASLAVSGAIDALVDGPQSAVLGVAAADFAGSTATITVLDTNRPQLALNFSTNSVQEGRTVAAIVSRDGPVDAPVTISVSSSQAGQLLTATSVTIAAGESSNAFPVLAIADALIEPPFSYVVTVNGTGYIAASSSITVLDDSMPDVTLRLAQHNVSESAGPNATVATITRTPASYLAVDLDLESTSPTMARVPSRVTIPANAASVNVPVAVFDNDVLDGTRSAELRVWIRASGSNLRLAQGNADTLTVSDDDGPTLRLSLASAIVGEGLNPATTATVSRNGSTNAALSIALASDNTAATVPPNVLLAEGATSVTFPISTPVSVITDSNRIATITASAADWASGVAPLVVTDTLRPDLVVASITFPASAETEAFASIGYQVRNQGLSAMASNVLAQRILLSRDQLLGDDQPLGQFTFGGALPPNQHFGQTFQLRLPQAAGTYWVIVQTDASNAVSEILEDNNITISSTPIELSAAYAVEVSTPLESGAAGTRVPFSGRAYKPLSGAPAPFVLANIHIRVRGTRRVISALTDAQGNFSASWQPLPGEAGFYEVAGAHPGEMDPLTQDSFTLFGMTTAPSALFVTVPNHTTVTGSVDVRNAGDVPLHGLSAVVASQPGNLSVSVMLETDSLGSLGTNRLSYSITANGVAVPTSTVTVRVTNAQAAVDLPINISVVELQPRLVSDVTELVAGMKRGVQTLVSLRVVNAGGAASAPVSVALPAVPWMSVVSPNPLPGLAPGETNTIQLQLLPPSTLPLGSYDGSLLVSDGNTGVNVPFKFLALSDAKGDLLVSVVDELTFYAEGAPRVTNAVVRLLDRTSSAVVTNGVTDANGRLLLTGITEGYYDIEVTAPRHTASRRTHLIRAGITNSVEAFISRETVRYTWTVVPTEIQDRYRIVVESSFEANVPLPVVTMSPSVVDLAEMVGDEWQIDLTVTNHGLIAAQNFRLQLDDHPQFTFTPLISNAGSLPARSSLTIPLVIRRVGASAAGLFAKSAGAKAASIGSCAASGVGLYDLLCGGNANTYGTPLSFPNAGNCPSGPTVPAISFGGFGGGFAGGGGAGGGGGGGGGGRDGHGGSSSGGEPGFFPNVPSLNLPSPCDACGGQLVPALLDCLPGISDFLPLNDAEECVKGTAECLPAIFDDDGLTLRDAVGCLDTLGGCLETAGKAVPGPWKLLPYVDCGLGILEACPEILSSLRPSDKSKAVASSPYAGLVRQFARRFDRLQLVLDHQAYLFGDRAWIYSEEQGKVGEILAAFQPMKGSNSDAGYLLSTAEAQLLLQMPVPAGLTTTHLEEFIARWNRSVTNWQAGIFSLSNAPVGTGTNFIALDELSRRAVAGAGAVAASRAEGFASIPDGIASARLELQEALAVPSEGVCARVGLRIEQEAVLTREAFAATLELENRDAVPLENLRVQLRISDAAGNNASNFFGVLAPTLVNLGGVDGTGTLAPEATGSARWTIVPSREAAPNQPVEYFVSGELSYTLAGALVTVPLVNVGITVHPSPLLVLDYFHERDVFADDPYTDIVEPSVPYSLAVMARNLGAGTARNFRITSAQPEIVDNEKGLLIDFKIIGTEVAGQNLAPTLTAEFGAIPPGNNVIGRWLLTSTLQGLFDNYSASFEHIDDLGNESLSLIESVHIHEMIHVVQVGGAFEDHRPDFLVNDVLDANDLPDTLYLSDGSTSRVAVATSAITSGALSPANLQVQISAPLPGGWSYVRVPDPANGQFRLVEVRRSDNVLIALDTNVWITDRTFPGFGRRPVREFNLHLLDFNSTGTYILTYAPNPALDTEAPASAIAALSANSRASIRLEWAATDTGGSGVAGCDIYVSEDGGAFQRWLSSARESAALYVGTLGKTYAFYSVAVDHAGNRESAPSSPDVVTSVTLTNRAPTILPLPTSTIVEGDTLVLNLSASDPDGDALSFSLGANAPAGVLLNPQNGTLTWATAEALGPSTNIVTVIARDKGLPMLSATQSFSIVVLETNSAPVLAPISNRIVSEGQLLTFTNAAIDADAPSQQLTFSLGPNAPLGAALNPASGIFTWTPSDTQGGTTNTVAMIVIDNGPGLLSATQRFSVVVRDTRPDFAVSIGSTQLLAAASASVPFVLNSGVELTNVNLVLAIAGDRLAGFNVSAAASEVASVDWLPLDGNRMDIRLRSQPDALLQGQFVAAQFDFATTNHPRSGVVVLRGEALTGEAAGLRFNGSVGMGRIFVVGDEPILDIAQAGNGTIALTLYAKPGQTYRLERRAGCETNAAWRPAENVTPDSLKTALPPRTIIAGSEMFRVVTADAGVYLTIGIENGNVVLEWPICDGCVLEHTATAENPHSWQASQPTLETNGQTVRATVVIGNARQFFRLTRAVP